MELGLALTLCGLGAAFLLPALILALIAGNRKRKCTVNTNAVVMDVKVRNSGDDGLTFYPVYEYYAGGVRYTGVGASSSHHVPQKNTVIPVMYNPRNPKQSYIQGYDNKIYRILISVFAVIGAIPIIICIFIGVLT